MNQDAPSDRRQWVLSVLERYEIPLLRYTARLLGDEDQARDVVQFAFMRLCREPPEALRDRVAQWLFTVCRNRTIDLLRGAHGTTSMSDVESEHCRSREPDPSEAAEREELCRRLVELLDRLPSDQREAIALWCEGFAYREISGITGHSEGNVRVLVHRGLKRLRQQPLVSRLLEVVPAPAAKSMNEMPL